MTRAELESLANAMAGPIKELVDLKIQEALRSALKATGVFTTGKAYAVNDVVTRDGSLWRCLEAHVAATFDHRCWELAVKHGRDGRDAR